MTHLRKIFFATGAGEQIGGRDGSATVAVLGRFPAAASSASSAFTCSTRAIILEKLRRRRRGARSLRAAAVAASAVSTVSVNGRRVAFSADTLHGSVPAVSVRGAWAGQRFGRAQEVGTAAGFSGGAWSGSFSVPAAVVTQLAARNASRPRGLTMRACTLEMSTRACTWTSDAAPVCT